jgi:AcrR family transcriptional regulator
MPPERVLLSHEALVAAFGDRWSPSEVRKAVELLAGGDGRFPPGAKELPTDLVKAVQRERLLAAMLRAAAELGYRHVTVKHVIDRAGVSRPTFYEHFENREDCFLAAFDAAATRLRSRIDSAAGAGGEHWRDRLRMGIEELLRFVATEPDAARTLIVEARGASPGALQRHDALLDHFTGCIDAQVRGELPQPPSGIAAAGIVGGIEALLYSRLYEGETDELESLLPSLMYFAVLPFAGPEAAGEELGDTALR